MQIKWIVYYKIGQSISTENDCVNIGVDNLKY